MTYQIHIGLELHIQLNTKSKLFSSAPNSIYSESNTCVNPFDIAHIGTLPLLNKKAVVHAIRVANALHMNIERELWFDRKNYFYSDLAKGYQITQEFRPLGKNGYLTIDGEKVIINRLHLEEDTCKQVHYDNYSLLDYNRSGIPLIEIVCEPTLSSGKQARLFVEKIRSIVMSLDASSGKMQDGAIRCDVNISLSESELLGTKVEIKNLNSLNNIELAVDYEIKRQKEILLKGNKIEQETRRFDEGKKETVLMRIKSDNLDYRCFVDPDIPPVLLSEKFIKETIESSNELPDQRIARYKDMGVSNINANLLNSNKKWYELFDACSMNIKNVNTLANWIINVGDKISENDLCLLINKIEEGSLSFKSAKDIYYQNLSTNQSIENLISINSLNSDEEYISSLVIEVIKECKDDCKSLYQSGKDRIVGYLVGQVMKKTNGKANPALTSNIIVEKLKEG